MKINVFFDRVTGFTKMKSSREFVQVIRASRYGHCPPIAAKALCAEAVDGYNGPCREVAGESPCCVAEQTILIQGGSS